MWKIQLLQASDAISIFTARGPVLCAQYTWRYGHFIYCWTRANSTFHYSKTALTLALGRPQTLLLVRASSNNKHTPSRREKKKRIKSSHCAHGRRSQLFATTSVFAADLSPSPLRDLGQPANGERFFALWKGETQISRETFGRRGAFDSASASLFLGSGVSLEGDSLMGFVNEAHFCPVLRIIGIIQHGKH